MTSWDIVYDMIAMSMFTDGHFGSLVAGGIVRYALDHPNGEWDNLVLIPPLMINTGGLGRYNLSGLIVAIWNPQVEKEIKDLGIPAVNISDQMPRVTLPSIGVDDDKVGQVAAQYFLDRGYRNFAFVPEKSVPGYALRRGQSFTTTIQSAGHEVAWYGTNDGYPASGIAQGNSDELTHWLANLPKPLAVFASEDRTAAEVHASAVAARLRVPEHVAILGVDNDPNMHYMTSGISSIELPMSQIGQEAAALLTRIMSGQNAPETIQYFPPGDIITRTSSDTRAIVDDDVLEALTFIRENSDRPIDVCDVADAAALSRRSLERRFRAALRISPKDEIQRMRVTRACKLLSTTPLGIDEISRISGFQSRSQFFVRFQKAMKMTPGQYRSLLDRHPDNRV